MNKKGRLQMRIAELFRFVDGRTVFVDPLEGDAGFVGPCVCRLVVDGHERATIRIEGEMILDHAHPEGHRSVSTIQEVLLERDTVLALECVLESVSERLYSFDEERCEVVPASCAGGSGTDAGSPAGLGRHLLGILAIG